MVLITIIKLLHYPLVILNSALPWMSLGIERVNFLKNWIIWNAENRTRVSWMRSPNTTSIYAMDWITCYGAILNFLNSRTAFFPSCSILTEILNICNCDSIQLTQALITVIDLLTCQLIGIDELVQGCELLISHVVVDRPGVRRGGEQGWIGAKKTYRGTQLYSFVCIMT